MGQVGRVQQDVPNLFAERMVKWLDSWVAYTGKVRPIRGSQSGWGAQGAQGHPAIQVSRARAVLGRSK